MPAEPDFSQARSQRNRLLLEAVGLLLDELSALAAQDWERLPELRKKKVVAACRLRQLRAETEAADGAPVTSLESLIADLEAKSRDTIRARLNVIGYQFLALQELSLHLNESLHVTLQRSAVPG
jgi:multidrug resistance efflux pump